jgi:4-amino-4-deoxy-L-arabinose transferase-like glycosyltransferase
MRAVVANPAPTHVQAGAAGQGHEETQRGAKRFIVRHMRFALTLVLAAFILRAIAAIVLHEVSIAEGGNGFFFEDDRGYDRLAWQQVEAWHGVGPDVDPGERYLMNAYVHAEAAVYFVAGHHLLVMKLLNCFFGALTAGLIFLIARRLFGGPAGAFAGIAAAVFPSTFLWSLMSLKDTMFIFAAALLLWLITLLLKTGRWLLILPILAAFALVGGLRTYVQAMFTLLIPATVLLQSRVRLPRKWALSAVLLTGCLALLWVSGGVQWFGVPVDQVNRMRYCMVAGANSAYVASSEAAAEACADEEAVPARSLQEIVAWLPTGTWHVIAAPFPWAADTTAERAAMPEMMAWYLAVTLAALAIVHHWRDWRDYVHLIGYIGGIAFLLAITQGNLGTLVRHRGMIIPFVLVFSGAGAAWLWSRWRARRSATSVMRLDHLTSRLMNLS